jgi:thioredoxin-like negative regulator of GroEL
MPINATSAVSGLAPRFAADPVPVIRPNELQKTIAKGPVVVEFFNYGCPYCRAAMPELDRVATEKLGKVKFAKMSLGDPEAQRLAAQFGVSLLPGFAVFHDGQFLGEFGRQGAGQVGADFIRDNVEYAFSSVGVQV